jgi:hypothetical protein
MPERTLLSKKEAFVIRPPVGKRANHLAQRSFGNGMRLEEEDAGNSAHSSAIIPLRLLEPVELVLLPDNLLSDTA